MNNKNLLIGFSAAIILGIAFVFASFVGVQKYSPIQNTFYVASAPTSQSIYENSATTLINSTFIGPSNIGGRVRALLIDKTNPNLIYAGSCGGGLWKTEPVAGMKSKVQLFAAISAVETPMRRFKGK